MIAVKSHALVGADDRPYQSRTKGLWGGHRGTRAYGRLDCPAALRAIARGGLVEHRVRSVDQGLHRSFTAVSREASYGRRLSTVFAASVSAGSVHTLPPLMLRSTRSNPIVPCSTYSAFV